MSPQSAKAGQAEDGTTSEAETESPFPARKFVYGLYAMYALPLLVALLLAAADIWSLVTRKASEWFAFAARIRVEHRFLKEQFQ